MKTKSATEIVGTIVDELTPLSSEERQRVIQASLALLGEAPIQASRTGINEQRDGDQNIESLPDRAKTWARQNDLSLEQLQQVFHVSDDGVEVIAAEIPGKTYRERVRNAYVLLGIASLLSSGNAKFDDKAARVLCEASGFYDRTNHMKFMKGGNEFIGTKDKGWTLTPPGRKRGATLVAELSKGI
jgi:hypothetical protein